MRQTGIIFAALLAGIVGGMFGSQITGPRVAEADGPKVHDVVFARQFRMIGPNDKTRIVMMMVEDIPVLALYDSQGNPRATLKHDTPTNATGLTLMNREGKQTLAVRDTKDGLGWIDIFMNGKRLWYAPQF